MNKAMLKKIEKEHILPDYFPEMDSSSNYSVSDDDDDLMADFLMHDKKITTPNKPLPKMKKVRVLVKRLSRDVVQRYQKKKYATNARSTVSTSNRPLQRPSQKPLQKQMLMNKPQSQIRQIVKSVSSKPNAATLNVHQNNFTSQLPPGQKLSGVYRSGSAIATKHPPNTNVNRSNVSIKQIKHLPQTDYSKISAEKKHESIGSGSSVENVSVVKVGSNKFIEMRKDTIQVKREVNRTAFEEFLSNLKKGQTGASITQKSVDVKKVIVHSVGSNKNQEILSKNTIRHKSEVNRAIVMNKQSAPKKDFTIPTGSQQNLSNKQQTCTIKSNVSNISSVNKNVLADKNLAGKRIQLEDLDKNPDRQMVRKSFNINQPFNMPPNAASSRIVKQPKMVKVPISKLIKIPQGITVSKTTEKPGTIKALNRVKNFEMVNVSKVIKNSDTVNQQKFVKTAESYRQTKEAKGPEMLNQQKVINIPQANKISKAVNSTEMVNVAKLPNTQKLSAVKLLDSKTIKNVTKVPGTVLISKAMKMPESETTAGTSKLKFRTLYHSQSTQTEADDRTTPKTVNTASNSQVKSVQTKFTCNDNICGIIDTAEFNINCFYCYDVFPLRKWSTFINHMKNSHRLVERAHAVVDVLLKPKNIIPYGTRSKEVQVNTLRGRNVLGGKRKIGASQTYITKHTVTDDMDSTYDGMENDLEMALNCLDEDESDIVEELINMKSNCSPPKKIVKLENEEIIKPQDVALIEPKVEDEPHTTIKTMTELKAKLPDSHSTASQGVVVSPKSSTAASNAIKLLTGHPLLKNKIMNLPSNIKIIKKLPNKESCGEAKKSPEQISDNKKPKIVVIKKIINPMFTTVKTEDALASPTQNTTLLDVTDSVAEGTVQQSNGTKDISFEFVESRLDDTSVDDKNDSLDISKTDVEQNVKIEPDFDNDSGDESALIRLKDEAKRRTRKYVNWRKNMLTQKPKPIPSSLLDSNDEMPSNDDNEDELPSPTNGCGILFGLTNRNIVTAFINELQKYPELWQFNRNNDITINYTDSIRNLYQHINEKFSLEMTDFEVRLSVQRIKYWYCRTLQKMEKHNKSPQANKGPYKHTFPEYFQMLQKFLSYDSNCTKDLVLGKRFQQNDVNELNRYPKWMLYKEPGGGGDKRPIVMTDDRWSLARDLAFSDDGETDQEEEGYTPSLKPFKSELDTSGAPPDPFICDICFIDFNSMVELTRHRTRHFPPQYPCSTCKRMFYSSHMANKCDHGTTKMEMAPKQPAKGQQPTLYVCEICGVSYKSVSTLNYHKKDKHFNMRHKCPVCKFTSISNYRMVHHQKKRHVVEFGTCEEIAKRTRARTDSKIPFNAEARREFEWRREMRKKTKPEELFYGCYKCKQIFTSRKEKVQHNRQEHPITEATVVCQLCNKEKALFSNSNSVRRHYTDVHKVPWNEIDELVKRTKPLFQVLTPLEVDQLKSSDNPSEFVAKTLAKKLKAEQHNVSGVGCEITRAIKSVSEDIEEELNHTYDPFKFENNTERRLKMENIVLSHDEDSIDDDYYQSTFFNDIGIDHNYDDMEEDSYDEDDNDDYYSPQSPEYGAGKELQKYEYQDEDGNEHYIIEEECTVDEEYSVVGVGQPQDQQLIYDEGVMNEEEIVEEIVEYDFMEDVMEERF